MGAVLMIFRKQTALETIQTNGSTDGKQFK